GGRVRERPGRGPSRRQHRAHACRARIVQRSGTGHGARPTARSEDRWPGALRRLSPGSVQAELGEQFVEATFPGVVPLGATQTGVADTLGLLWPPQVVAHLFEQILLVLVCKHLGADFEALGELILMLGHVQGASRWGPGVS